MSVNDNFTPVRPDPPDGYPNLFKQYRQFSKDLIGVWPKDAYECDFFGGKLINRYIFIANSPDTVEHTIVKNNDIYQRKSPFMRKALKPLLGDGLFISDGETWKQRRSMEAPAFKPDKLKIFSGVMTECANECSKEWGENFVGKEVLVLQQMASLTAEILSRAMFGNDLGHQNAEKIVTAFSEYQACIKQLDLASFFGLPEWLPKLPQRKRSSEMAKQIHVVVDNVIQEHLSNKVEQKTLLSMLLHNYKADGSGLITLEQVRNEAVVILMAGHETTANSLAWTWYLLATHPDKKEKLHEELDRVLDGRQAEFDDVSKLTYTRAVFEEALRLYPPVPLLSRQSNQEDEIEGKKIPSNSIMLIVPWLLHRNEKYWIHPHHFIPERFLKNWPKKHQKYAYIPFSTGPRNCLGAAFGLTEAILCLATLAQEFDLMIKPGHEVDYECRLTLRPKNGLPMIVKKRN